MTKDEKQAKRVPVPSFSLGINNVEPSLDDRLAAKADAMLLQVALGASADNRATPRQKAIAALEAACEVLADLLPTHAQQLNAPLLETLAELRELDAGMKAGPITREREAYSHRGDSIKAITRQARAVLAAQWLQRLGMSPREAYRHLSRSGYGATPRQIENWVGYFRRKNSGRRPEILTELAQDFEKQTWESFGRLPANFTVDDVTRWLRPPTESKN